MSVRRATTGVSREGVIAVVIACAAAGCSTEPPPLANDPAPTWESIEASFAIGCAGQSCHVRSGDDGSTAPAEGLDLRPGHAYRMLLGTDCLGQESAQTFGDRARPRLVVRGDPDASYLLCKLDPECDDLAPGTVHMPPVGGTRDPTLLARVRAWIAVGALGPPDPEGDGCAGPPSFAGATSASRVAPDAVEVRWEPARDPRGDAFAIGYRLYVGTAPGAVDFTRPRVDIAPSIGREDDPASAVRGTTLDGLRQGWRYVFVARAYGDGTGEDDNRVEVDVVLDDVEAPTFDGVDVGAAFIGDDTRLHLSWEPARDNVDPARLVRYVVLVSDRSLGWDPARPALVTEPGALEAIIDPIDGAETFVAVRARDRAGNTDTNTIEAVVGARDAVPPSFTGVESVIASPGALTVAWPEAVDDVTPVGELDYLVFVGTAAGGAFEETPRVVRGATSAAIGSLAPSTRYFVVVRARDAAGNVDGNTRELSATTPAFVDTSPPDFAGATRATAIVRGARLEWAAASDDTSAPEAIQYLVWQAAAAGAEVLAGPPTYETAFGATSFDVLGLDAGSPAFFVVRARDPAGNVDANRVEVAATPLADTTPPTFAGIESATAASASAVTLTWSAASDDASAASAIRYAVYVAAEPAPIVFATPIATSAAGATSITVTGLVPGDTYTFVVRARDEAGNEDENAVERSVALDDTNPPVFAGVASATATGTTNIDLAWAAATDDVTPPSSIVYLVFRATASGAQTFTTPTATTVAGATTFSMTGLDPGTRYFFVVRARDGAANVDANTVEASATTDEPVARFATDVQPLLDEECAFVGCHGSGAGGLDLRPGRSYAAMVGVASRDCPTTLQVAPGDPAASFLYQKVTGVGLCATGGGLMPRGRPPLTASELEIIRLWIALGARND